MAVHAACLDLAERGIRPTLDEVQKITGGGQTLISAHVKTWWAKNPHFEYLKKQKRRRMKWYNTHDKAVREALDWIVEVIRIGTEVHWQLPSISLNVRYMVGQRLTERSLDSVRSSHQHEEQESEREEYVVGSDRPKRETRFNDEDIEQLKGD